MKNKKLFVLTAILMFILGSSDALRGIFSPLFTMSFNLSVAEMGMIVSASYLGNLIFLISGGMILDRIGIRRSFVIFIILLAVSELLLALSSSFLPLAIGFFLTLGLSTLLNTTINLFSDRFSDTKALMYLNMLFFIQGMGMTLSQLVFSRFSSSILCWHLVLGGFILLLLPIAFLLMRDAGLVTYERNKEEEKDEEEGPQKIRLGALSFITLSLSFYLICEHGVMNYLILYGKEALGRETSIVGNALALFSLGIMSGRLLFSPVIDRVGDRRMMFFSLLAASISAFLVFYLNLLFCTLFLGLASSTVYPTMVAMTRKYVPSHLASRATTVVISIASITDILFNLGFGKLTSTYGYDNTMLLLALSNLLASLFVVPLLLKRN